MKQKVKAEKFFKRDELERITKTIHEVESHTIGEVAVMVVDSSDHYIEAEILGGIFLASLLSLVMTTLNFHSSVWAYISLSFILFFPSKYLFEKIPVLKTAFMGVKRKETAVMQRAVRAFYEKGLYKTRKNTGVLFFMSLLERKVWVLADKGIYEKIEQDTLNRHSKMVSQGIKDGRACDALCDAIKESGELLARHFPITHDDKDELSDEVMTE
jgi:putative membrane protein